MFVDWLSSVCSVNTSERLKMWMYYGMESKMSSKLFKYCPRAHEHTQLGPCTCKTLIILFKKLFQVCTYSMLFFFPADIFSWQKRKVDVHMSRFACSCMTHFAHTGSYLLPQKCHGRLEQLNILTDSHIPTLAHTRTQSRTLD